MTSQYIWIVYTFNLKILRQRLLRFDICKLNVTKKFVRKRHNLTLNMIISRKCARITLISSNSCDFCINCWINLRNFKISLLTIKMKIKNFRASEITRLTQLKMQNDRTRRSCRQIYLCTFEKMTTVISEIEKIVATIIIKSLKHSTKLNVIHATKRNIS